MRRLLIIGKKTFSLSLIFNSLLTIACSIGILAGFYWFYHDWQPFYPYVVNGNLFWVAIAVAVVNIFPSASLARALKTGRFLFHHYFYGCLILLSSVFYVVAFTPVSLLTIFLIDNTSIAVNIGRFFLLGGATLVLDDLPDVSKRIASALNWLKSKASQRAKVILVFQLLAGAVSFYLFVAICIALSQNPQWVTLANLILIGTLFVTSFSSFLFVKRRLWLNIETAK